VGLHCYGIVGPSGKGRLRLRARTGCRYSPLSCATVLLSTNDSISPNACEGSRAGVVPPAINRVTTAAARCWDSVMLAALPPTLRVDIIEIGTPWEVRIGRARYVEGVRRCGWGFLPTRDPKAGAISPEVPDAAPI
jgi:hypothetical protein